MKKLLNLVGLLTLAAAGCTATTAGAVAGKIDAARAAEYKTAVEGLIGNAEAAGTYAKVAADFVALQTAAKGVFGDAEKIFNYTITNDNLTAEQKGKILADNLQPRKDDGTVDTANTLTGLRTAAASPAAKAAFLTSYGLTVAWALQQTALPHATPGEDVNDLADNALVQAVLDYKAKLAAAAAPAAGKVAAYDTQKADLATVISGTTQ